jgi:macrolide phosphotransferase
MINSVKGFLSAAREHGLLLNATSRDLDESGAEFLVMYAVDEHGVPWVLRTPRRADILARIEVENRALELVRSRLPVSVPEWCIRGPELIAYPRLPGEPAAVMDEEGKQYLWRFNAGKPPVTLLESLAAAMVALHAIDPTEARTAGLPTESPYQVRQRLAEQMERTRDFLDVPDATWRRWQRWVSDASYWPPYTVLIHGDLHAGHVLIDREHRVTGLLDWTEARVSDPAADFILLYDPLGADVLADLITRYERSGGRVWARMHEHIVERWYAYPVAVAEWARGTGEEEHRRFGQWILDENSRRMGEG